MSLEQVSLDIMNVNFNINTPAEEKDTLLQAVDMLNKKNRNHPSERPHRRYRQNRHYGRTQRRPRPTENEHERRFGNRRV